MKFLHSEMTSWARRLIYTLIVLLGALNLSAQSTATSQVTTFEIDAPQLKTSKKIWVWLPKNYEKSKKKYPVLYMHDAQNVFDSKTSYSGEWNVDETLDSINAQVIVIAIEHGNEKRIDELTPYPNAKYGGGKADLYVDFIVSTVKPAIDKRYRTKKNAANTAIMGSSLGGLVSFYAAVKHPNEFGKAGVFSPSFWFSEQIFELAQRQQKINSRLYFVAGDKESDGMVADMDKMFTIVKEKHTQKRKGLAKKIVAGGEHNEKLWRENFLNAYLWLF